MEAVINGPSLENNTLTVKGLGAGEEKERDLAATVSSVDTQTMRNRPFMAC